MYVRTRRKTDTRELSQHSTCEQTFSGSTNKLHEQQRVKTREEYCITRAFGRQIRNISAYLDFQAIRREAARAGSLMLTAQLVFALTL